MLFAVVQQHLIEQHGMLFSVSEYEYKLSYIAAIHACACCFSSSKELIATGCTSVSRGWVIRFRSTGGANVYERGKMGPPLPVSVLCATIRKRSWSNPGFCDKGN